MDERDHQAMNEEVMHTSPLDSIKERFNSDKFINNVCISYRHDFGLMTKEEQEIVRFECKEWMRAIINNYEYF